MSIDKDKTSHVKKLFTKILDVDVIVDKQREIYLIDNVRIHIDTIKNLGTYFEFEAVYKDDTIENSERESAKVKQLMTLFEISSSDLIQGSYREMIKQSQGHYDSCDMTSKENYSRDDK